MELEKLTKLETRKTLMDNDLKQVQDFINKKLEE